MEGLHRRQRFLRRQSSRALPNKSPDNFWTAGGKRPEVQKLSGARSAGFQSCDASEPEALDSDSGADNGDSNVQATSADGDPPMETPPMETR